jgi:hypothetical protein
VDEHFGRGGQPGRRCRPDDLVHALDDRVIIEYAPESHRRPSK